MEFRFELKNITTGRTKAYSKKLCIGEYPSTTKSSLLDLMRIEDAIVKNVIFGGAVYHQCNFYDKETKKLIGKLKISTIDDNRHFHIRPIKKDQF